MLTKFTLQVLRYFQVPESAYICGFRSQIFRIPLTNFSDSTDICGFHLHFVNPLTVAESRRTSYIRLLRSSRHSIYVDKIYTYICGFHLQFVNTLTVAESRTTTYIRSLRNPRHNKYANIIYVTGFTLLSVCRIRIYLRFPLTNFADSTHICGFH